MRGKHMHVWMCRHVKLVHSWTSSLCHRPSWVGLWDFSLLPKTRFLGSVPNRTNALLLFFFFWLCTSRLQLIQKKFCLLWFRELLHSPQWPPKYIRVLIHHSPHLSFSRNFTLLLPSHHKLLKKKRGILFWDYLSSNLDLTTECKCLSGLATFNVKQRQHKSKS